MKRRGTVEPWVDVPLFNLAERDEHGQIMGAPHPRDIEAEGIKQIAVAHDQAIIHGDDGCPRCGTPCEWCGGVCDPCVAQLRQNAADAIAWRRFLWAWCVPVGVQE